MSENKELNEEKGDNREGNYTEGEGGRLRGQRSDKSKRAGDRWTAESSSIRRHSKNYC